MIWLESVEHNHISILKSHTNQVRSVRKASVTKGRGSRFNSHQRYHFVADFFFYFHVVKPLMPKCNECGNNKPVLVVEIGNASTSASACFVYHYTFMGLVLLVYPSVGLLPDCSFILPFWGGGQTGQVPYLSYLGGWGGKGQQGRYPAYLTWREWDRSPTYLTWGGGSG